jgi:hypothetical protein
MVFTLVTLKLKVNLEACLEAYSEIELDKRGITGEHIVTPLRTAQSLETLDYPNSYIALSKRL